jgi:type I restriction enzyme M protein
MMLLRRFSAKEREVAASSKLDYPIFMAVAEKIGHDKRGNTIYRRTETGDDLIIMRREVQSEIDPETGLERTREVEVSDLLPDDELPEVATAFRKWLGEQG